MTHKLSLTVLIYFVSLIILNIDSIASEQLSFHNNISTSKRVAKHYKILTFEEFSKKKDSKHFKVVSPDVACCSIQLPKPLLINSLEDLPSLLQTKRDEFSLPLAKVLTIFDERSLFKQRITCTLEESEPFTFDFLAFQKRLKQLDLTLGQLPIDISFLEKALNNILFKDKPPLKIALGAKRPISPDLFAELRVQKLNFEFFSDNADTSKLGETNSYDRRTIQFQNVSSVIEKLASATSYNFDKKSSKQSAHSVSQKEYALIVFVGDFYSTDSIAKIVRDLEPFGSTAKILFVMQKPNPQVQSLIDSIAVSYLDYYQKSQVRKFYLEALNEQSKLLQKPFNR